jgi:hypothetical protein
MVVILTLFSSSVIRWQSCARTIVLRQGRSLLSPHEILNRHIGVQEYSQGCRTAEVRISWLGYWGTPGSACEDGILSISTATDVTENLRGFPRIQRPSAPVLLHRSKLIFICYRKAKIRGLAKQVPRSVGHQTTCVDIIMACSARTLGVK